MCVCVRVGYHQTIFEQVECHSFNTCEWYCTERSVVMFISACVCSIRNVYMYDNITAPTYTHTHTTHTHTHTRTHTHIHTYTHTHTHTDSRKIVFPVIIRVLHQNLRAFAGALDAPYISTSVLNALLGIVQDPKDVCVCVCVCVCYVCLLLFYVFCSNTSALPFEYFIESNTSSNTSLSLCSLSRTYMCTYELSLSLLHLLVCVCVYVCVCVI